MRRLLVTVLVLLSALSAQAQAQTQPGSPPLLDHLSIAPAEGGLVTISGGVGSVFPIAYVAVRNLDTGATVSTHAGPLGRFNVQIAGTEASPYWISPSEGLEDLKTAALPGGPGVILYNPLALTPKPAQTMIGITIDGDPADWNASALRYSSGARAIYAVRNADSLYVAVSGSALPTDYTQVEIRFTVDTTSYAVMLDPHQAKAAALTRTNPSTRTLAPLIVAARQASALEVRIPLTFVTLKDRISLDAVRWLDPAGVEIGADTIGAEIPPSEAADGVARPLSAGIAFSLAGATPDGVNWSAQGQISTLALAPGDALTIQMNIEYGANSLPPDAALVGQVALQPVAQRVSGEMRAVSGVSSNNGWTSFETAGGLPIDNLPSSIALGEVRAQPYALIRGQDSIRFPLDFTLTVPDDLPPGLYVPFFSGTIQTTDGNRTPWTQDGTHLPLVVNVGGVGSVRLPWALLADDPSNGSRGILPIEDRNEAALSNRVRFNSPTLILPPFKPGTRDAIAYPLEPYLLGELGNQYGVSSAPLIPFQFPGQISAKVTRPDGTVDNLGDASIVQNQLSTGAADERTLFGQQSPVDEYRLATLDAKFSAYQFKQYGEYTVNLSGGLNDVWGNRYDGGGTYKILVAELLDLTPGTMSGTPFQVGGAFNAGLHLSPGVPADVTVTVRVYPLDGSAPITHTFQGKANAHGYFQPSDAPLMFDTPGEYVVDYEARYSGADQRLWAASARGAGVIASPAGAVVAHGERGLPGIGSGLRLAWFNTAQYAQAAGLSGDLNALSFPYFSGDVAWVNDGRSSRIEPGIRVQAGVSGYADWLIGALPDGNLRQRAAEGELPVPKLSGSDSYTYISAVRPNVSVRQFISGSDAGGLTLGWDEDDPLNQQIGAGSGGNMPGDVIFLFGGAVIRAGEVRAAAIYSALAVVGADETPRIYPPDRGTAGGADGGALLTLGGQPVDTFINLTGVQPGDVLTLGDTITLAGQVAPTTGATITTTFTAPSGNMREFVGKANAVGYYYDPSAQFAIDEPGVWTVDVAVTLDGATSAGQIEPPAPQGSLLGAPGGRFSIYVLPADAAPLPWNPLLTDTLIPILSPYNFSFTLPADWSNLNVYYTLMTPGLLIEDGTLHLSGRSFTYAYSETEQNHAFPNLEVDRRSGAWLSDTRTLTFVATGVDASGAAQIRSRTFTLMHDRLITTE